LAGPDVSGATITLDVTLANATCITCGTFSGPLTLNFVSNIDGQCLWQSDLISTCGSTFVWRLYQGFGYSRWYLNLDQTGVGTHVIYDQGPPYNSDCTLPVTFDLVAWTGMCEPTSTATISTP
jgi:hypothetical protein